jgi:nitrile hydratase
LLGIPPSWYKSDAYRARVVREPRKVLADFGVSLPEETAVRVWDSTAEVRYLVLPMRPEGTEGWSEEALMALVSRDSMVGTAVVSTP